jgi:hypothetical protein
MIYTRFSIITVHGNLVFEKLKISKNSSIFGQGAHKDFLLYNYSTAPYLHKTAIKSLWAPWPKVILAKQSSDVFQLQLSLHRFNVGNPEIILQTTKLT